MLISSVPALSGSAPAVTLSTITTGMTSLVVLTINEPLLPSTATLQQVQLTPDGGKTFVPSNVVLSQFGTISNQPNVAEIAIITQSPLQTGEIYEVLISGVLDLGGNQLNPGPLLFTVQ